MFIPYSTNAPLYHLPIATICLILANILVAVGMVNGNIDPDAWLLWYGDGLHPDQWLTSFFSHGGIEHLVGNMLFLWVFGLIVEGKIGWWKFLLCYLGIGYVHAMLEQLVMLGYSGEVVGSLGASSAIFGIMAMAAIWAPLNEIYFFWFMFYRTGTFEVGVYIMAAFYVGMEVLMSMMYGGGAATSLLHISGAALGIPLGFAMLKMKLVDCDNEDLLSIWSGKYGNATTASEVAAERTRDAEQKKCRDRDQLTEAKAHFRRFLEQGNLAAALTLYNKMKSVGTGILPERDELVAIIKALQTAKRWRDSAPFMADLIQRFPQGADAIRLKLAQICVVELNRPGKALELIEATDTAKLPEPQRALAKKLVAVANQRQSEGEYEVDSDTW